jgi:serine/threonine protein kinase
MEVPICNAFPDYLSSSDFTDVRLMTDGSNSNIFLAQYEDRSVIIKMIKFEKQSDPWAIYEFNLELNILMRLSHPNIVKVLGAGRAPRKFIVLEWLTGGSLTDVLPQFADSEEVLQVNDYNGSSTDIVEQRISNPPMKEYLDLGLSIAEALHYLHSHVHKGLTVIHRDLKPSNIGFDSDGKVKIFDFGLVACVRQRQRSNEVYQLSGGTGSYRYMAPEVALKQPYTEKVDVYSYGIMLWQIITRETPFKKFSRSKIMEKVVLKGERPYLPPQWPPKLIQLLSHCWDDNPLNRPSFETVIYELKGLI